MGKSEYALSDNDRELYRPFSVVRQLSPASATALEFFSPLEDEVPARRSATAQQLCRDNLPHFWAKEEWPGNNPDLNPIEEL